MTARNPLALVTALSLAGVALAGGAALHAQNRTATLYARAVDPSGRSLTNVQPSEFQLTVDGKPGKIVSASYLGGPRRVLLLVSNNVQQQINPLREGLESFIAGVPSDDEIGLGTTAGQYHPRVDFSADRTRLLNFVKTLPVEDGDNVNMDALVEANNRFLQKETRPPVIVMVTTEGSEASSVRDEVFNRFVQQFTARGGVVHVVLVSVSAGGAPPRPTLGGNRARDGAILSVDTDAESMITMNVTKSTGGRYELINSITAIPDKLREIAADIRADQQVTDGWYKIVFSADKPPNTVRLNIDRPDTKLQLSAGRPKAASQ
jgi:hypothetical protein